MSNRLMSGILAALIVAMAFGSVFAGGVAATVETTEGNFTDVGDETLADETLTATNGTRSLLIELDNETEKASEPVNVTIFSVDDDGVTTEQDKVQLSAAENVTEEYEFTSLAIDSDGEQDYRVLVKGNSSHVDSAAINIGTVSEVSGGAGVMGGGSGGFIDWLIGLPGLIIAVAAGVLGRIGGLF